MVEVKEKINEKIDIKYPKSYCVVLYNDNTTPMDFVIEVLEEIFDYSEKDAQDKTYEIHEKGSGIIYVCTKEIAESLTSEVQEYSNRFGYSLKCTFELNE